jgi:cyclopropane fatty-acyl-phospholipid synthase-like methyltransferase
MFRSIAGLVGQLLNPTYYKYNGLMLYYKLTSDSHTEAYERFMQNRLNEGGHKAVGGNPEIGKLQLEFLKSQGLEPSDTLLDIGCGTLRAGHLFIFMLDPGNYTGMDISEDAIKKGKEMVGKQKLREQDPTFIVNSDLKFEEVEGSFDYALAQSVFTHLPNADIQECLSHISNVLEDDGEFYATILPEEEAGLRTKLWEHVYTQSRSEMQEWAATAGLEMTEIPVEEYPHPRDQRMLRFTPK